MAHLDTALTPLPVVILSEAKNLGLFLLGTGPGTTETLRFAQGDNRSSGDSVKMRPRKYGVLE